jgi:alpha(1,3/1,4) fucosyltransferase
MKNKQAYIHIAKFPKMSELKIAFTDFTGSFNPTRIQKLLAKKFDLTIDEENPDYIIYSIFGHQYLKYPEAVRIFFVGENVHPDFNLCDYAFGYDWMDFGDRFYRCPNYQLYDQFKNICDRKKSFLSKEDIKKYKPNFCNFIYSNYNSHPFRDEFYHLLNSYKKVDSAGSYLNNVGFTPGSAYKGDWSYEKVKFQKSYKFTIAFENSSTTGYTTEKIIHAFAADTIPIYWGNPEIGRELNTRRFINCHEHDSPDDVIQHIKQIDQNDELFLNILDEPFFPNDQVPDYLRDENILAQSDHIFSQSKHAAVRRNRYVWGRKYEEQRRSDIQASVTLDKLKMPFQYGMKIMRKLWNYSLKKGNF